MSYFEGSVLKMVSLCQRKLYFLSFYYIKSHSGVVRWNFNQTSNLESIETVTSNF